MAKQKGTPEERVKAIREAVRVSKEYGWGEYKIHPHLRKKGLPASYPLIRQAVTASRAGTLEEMVSYQLTKALPKQGMEKPHGPETHYQFSENLETGEGKLIWFGPQIDDPQELLEFCQIDTKVWEVVKQEIKSHKTAMKLEDGKLQKPAAVSLVNIHVTLKKRHHELAIRKVADELLKRMEKAAPKYKTVRRAKQKEPHLLETAIVDAHVGARILKHQTGVEYSPEQAADSIPWAIQQLVYQARGYEIERVLFVLGGDNTHFDNFAKTTTKGTLMDDAMEAFSQAFVLTEQAVVQSVDWLLAKVASVEIVMVPGNHDRNVSFALSRVLRAHYRKAKDVSFIDSQQPRQYVQYGVNLIGFAHGDLGPPERSAKAMPHECREVWGETRVHEIHHGHLHMVKTEDRGSIICRFLPNLCPPNKYANDKGYLSQHGAYAYAYHRERGQLGRFSTPIRDMDQAKPVVVL